jgi:hypothetical protein
MGKELLAGAWVTSKQ